MDRGYPIPPEALTQHTIVLGKTGSGKQEEPCR
jgi:type IV secretory pathway VirB4 component